MAWAETYKVVLGTFAFLIFWTLATFPTVNFLPIGRTAGALLGGTLMVVFQVLSPNQAFDAIDLPILGLLFGTMVISVYLERADLFKYLKAVLSWKCRGAKDLLIRISVFSALASALFTNDTICVIFTEFVLNLCKQHNLPPEPFLLALASSANIGSAATPIGNPQNLVIAIESKIQFGKFLIGVLPAMAAGIIFNILFLLALYWKPLSAGLNTNANSDVTPAPDQSMELETIKQVEVVSPIRSSTISVPSPRSPLAYEKLKSGPLHPGEYPPVEDEEAGAYSPGDKPMPLYSSRVYSPVHPIAEKHHQLYSPRVYSSPGQSPLGVYTSAHRNQSPVTTAARFYARDAGHAASTAVVREGPIVEIREHRTALREHLTVAKSGAGAVEEWPHDPEKLERGVEVAYSPWYRWGPTLRRRLWMAAVYGVTAGFLVALLSGLNLTWSALTAAVALMVLDFSDAGPSLDRVSYSLLVFFSGMFITVDGFNSTGAPGQFWNAVEPHTRINSAKGVAILSLVILVLSNVASNVPTVLLLGTRVAASAAAVHGASVTKAWLYLAWVSTVAGNFTLIGSAANLIVCEQARQAKPNSYVLTFWAHLKFGIPSTLIVIALGLPLVQG